MNYFLMLFGVELVKELLSRMMPLEKLGQVKITVMPGLLGILVI